MKFVLEVEMGNDAMCTYGDVLEALKKSFDANGLAPFEACDGEGGSVRDNNGNAVGRWEAKS